MAMHFDMLCGMELKLGMGVIGDGPTRFEIIFETPQPKVKGHPEVK